MERLSSSFFCLLGTLLLLWEGVVPCLVLFLFDWFSKRYKRLGCVGSDIGQILVVSELRKGFLYCTPKQKREKNKRDGNPKLSIHKSRIE